MKLTVELVSRKGYDRETADIDIKVDASASDKTLLSSFHIPIPGDGKHTTQDLLRMCFACQGDLYRELGVRNYRAFQADLTYFNNSSLGWTKFVTKVSTEDNRDELLQRMAQLIGAKMKMLVKKASPVAYNLDLEAPGPAEATVSFEDLTGKTLDIKLGNRIFKCTDVTEDASGKKLIDKALADIRLQAATKLDSYQAECAHNIELIKKQYDKRIDELNKKFENSVVAPELSRKLLRSGVLYCADHARKLHEFFIPIALEFKYISRESVRWELKKDFKLKQDVYLHVVTDSGLHVVQGNFVDKEFNDNIPQFHATSSGLCWGTYAPKIKTTEDLLRLRDDVAQIYSTINTQSMGSHNIPRDGPLRELYDVLSNTSESPMDDKIGTRNYGKVANLIDKKDPKASKGKDELWSA